MKQFLTSLLTLRRGAVFTLASAIMLSGAMNSSLRAADVTWDNGSENLLWDLSSLNWSGAAWNNLAGDGAVFGPTGVGTINVTGPMNVNSLHFTANGYSLNGAGSINFVDGTSTQTTSVITVDDSFSATLDVGLNSTLAFQKFGPGTLTLNSPSPITGLISLNGRDLITCNVLVGLQAGPDAGGMLRLGSASVFAPTTSVGIGNGYLDIRSNNVTLSSLAFTNVFLDFLPWNTTLNANNGVVGSGTLRVTGEINVIGEFDGSAGNAIAANLDLGGGTQVVRTSSQGGFNFNRPLMITGSISNGSLLKTMGYTINGILGTPDGSSYFGNNTYTGSTTMNGGFNVATGTNASTSIKVSGSFNAPATSIFALAGANGSFLSATTIDAVGGGTFQIDNTLSFDGVSQPNIPAAQNNNRLNDSAQVRLRDGNFSYTGKSATAASETYGSLNALNGFNTLTLATSGGGSATLTAGDLTLGSSTATLRVAVASSALGSTLKAFFNGIIPTADATGILPRIVSNSDFLTYSAVTGLTPLAAGAYATDFTGVGQNVAQSAAASINNATINALKTTGTFTTTLNAGQTLGINSGMLLTASGTHTLTGGTVAFGNTAGANFGNRVFNSAITGTQGLIMAVGTSTLAGDMSGLSGPLIVQTGTTNLNSNTFTGAIQNRSGNLNLNGSQTGVGLGAITLGVPEQDSNITATRPAISISGAGANAIFDRPLIVDNGATSAAGIPLRFTFLPTLAPLSNSTGSQTWNGPITLNTSLNLQGGGGSGTGATNFGGTITGPGTFVIPNGRVNFTNTSSYSNAGGFSIAEQGFTTQVSFAGTPGAVPIVLSGGNNSFMSYQPGSLPTGTITTRDGDQFSPATIIPLGSSTINNTMILNGETQANVGSGNTEWNGPISGAAPLDKAGAGTLTLGNATNSYAGGTFIDAGTLVANADGSLGTGSVSLSAASVTLTLQNGATHNYIADTATLDIGFTNDTVNLPFSGTDTIKALVINGVSEATGTWGSPTSAAMHTDPIFTGPGLLNVLTQLTVSSAFSRKNHGGTDFDLPLPLPPSNTAVEPRVGGLTNDYTIIVNFNDSVTVGGNPQAELIAGSGTVGSGGTPNGGMVTVSGNTVTIPLTNVTNQQVIQVRLNGVNGSSSFIIPMGVLVGDTNGDGTVSASDVGQTKAQSGNVTGAGNFRTDVNTSGSVNAADIGLVKSKSGTSLP